ncbi:hypothetical protein CEXT_625461 [Caerostris extrusa]|uniref:Uncharacterized protein n=1 Tax=Caerostris extrusa TaxID=172846 RepID=A0AAV4SB91_CAEEX|nr:hypothetical protein CEXT_625461 [Caerostris extrusa]
MGVLENPHFVGEQLLKNETVIRSRREQVLKDSRRFVLMENVLAPWEFPRRKTLIFGNGSEGEKWHFQSWLVAMGFVKRDTATQWVCFCGYV